MQEKIKKIPYAYFITFTTYGVWLHGDCRTSTDPKHNQFLTSKIAPNKFLHQIKQNKMIEKKMILNHAQREAVLNIIQEVCRYYRWHLFAAHVRSNHVHIILRASCAPEIVLRQIKAYATRSLKKNIVKTTRQKFWTRHGSTKYIWDPIFLYSVMKYIIEDQGEKMSLFYEKWYEDVDIADFDF